LGDREAKWDAPEAPLTLAASPPPPVFPHPASPCSWDSPGGGGGGGEWESGYRICEALCWALRPGYPGNLTPRTQSGHPQHRSAGSTGTVLFSVIADSQDKLAVQGPQSPQEGVQSCLAGQWSPLVWMQLGPCPPPGHPVPKGSCG
jgi:hypothetical protein